MKVLVEKKQKEKTTAHYSNFLAQDILRNK